MVLPDRWRCWRGSTGARSCPGGQRERSRRRSGSTAWTRTSRGFAAPPPRAGWPAASSCPTWGCRYTHEHIYTLCILHINTQQKVLMCMFVWVQYSFDERQPQGQGSAGQQGSDDTGDMDDSFSKQVNPHVSPWNQWHQWNSAWWRLVAWSAHVCVDVTALAFRQYSQIKRNTFCRFHLESSPLYKTSELFLQLSTASHSLPQWMKIVIMWKFFIMKLHTEATWWQLSHLCDCEMQLTEKEKAGKWTLTFFCQTLCTSFTIKAYLERAGITPFELLKSLNVKHCTGSVQFHWQTKEKKSRRYCPGQEKRSC